MLQSWDKCDWEVLFKTDVQLLFDFLSRSASCQYLLNVGRSANQNVKHGSKYLKFLD